MAIYIPGYTCQVTKESASGNFQFLILNPNGAVRFVFVLTSANMATAAALTSGNSASFTYAQDANTGDYPLETVLGV